MKENLESKMKETRKKIESIETEISRNRETVEEMRAEQNESKIKVELQLNQNYKMLMQIHEKLGGLNKRGSIRNLIP